MPRIGLLGTGDVAKQLGRKLVELGHEVRLGSRTAGNENASEWKEAVGDKGNVVSFADAASFADDVVLFCAMGTAATDILEAVGKEALAGKVLIDVSNPLDFSKGFPPSLSISNTDSLAEQLQAALPKTKVVKTLNMMSNPVMVNPGLLPEPTDVLLCGDDVGAKKKATELLASFGWERITDLGDITNARGMEAWLLLWTRLFGKLQTPFFNIKIVRGG